MAKPPRRSAVFGRIALNVKAVFANNRKCQAEEERESYKFVEKLLCIFHGNSAGQVKTGCLAIDKIFDYRLGMEKDRCLLIWAFRP